MRLVNVDNLKVDYIIASTTTNTPCYRYISEEQIKKAPTVDAEPMRHGYWIFNPKDAIEMMFTLPKCSECGAESPVDGNYCPHCGAKMDGEENETNVEC